MGFKIIESPPADLGKFSRRVHVRLIARWRRSREGHRDLPLTAACDKELRLQVRQRHLRKIKTHFLGNFSSCGRLQHTGLLIGDINVAANHSDHVRRIRDTRRPQYQQPGVATADQDADRDRVQLTVHG